MAGSSESVVRRFYDEMWNAGRLDVAEELFAEDCVTHQREDNRWVTYPRGPKAMREHVAEWRETLSRVRVEILHLVAAITEVAVIAELGGVHSGAPIANVQPGGAPFHMTWSVIYRLDEASKIAEDRVILDALGNLQELGVVRPSEELFT